MSAGKFHHICGKNVKLSEGDTVAERVRNFENGIVYTEQPIPVGTMFQIKLLDKTTDWEANLALGLTTLCPDGIEVVRCAFSLMGKPNYWLLSYATISSPGSPGKDGNYHYNMGSLGVGQSVGCMVNKKGDLHYFVDGKDQGLACSGLPTDQPLWGFVDIYGQALKIRSEFQKHPKSQPEQQAQLPGDEVSTSQATMRDQKVAKEQGETHQWEDASVKEKQSQLQLHLVRQRLDSAADELQHLSVSPQVASQQEIEAWKVPRSEVEILWEMDRGAWGTVAQGKFQGQLVAVKWPHPAILNEHTIERLRREVRIMAQVRHPNLLRFIAAVFDDQMPHLPPLIVMELLDTNLRTAYQNGKLSGFSKVSIFQDVAYALHYLHEHLEPIIHRDVSAPNVLLEALPNKMWRAKVSDFGSANLARVAQTMGEGAFIYAAPETIPQVHDLDTPPPPQTTKIDVYSYGVLLCEVITGQLPDPEQYRNMIQQVQDQWQFMHELIIHCTKRNPEERPTMAQILDKLNQLPRPKALSPQSS